MESRGSSKTLRSGEESPDKSEGKQKSSSSFGDYSEWSEDPFTLFFKKKAEEKQKQREREKLLEGQKAQSRANRTQQ